MSNKIKTLLEQRAKAVADARAVIELADKEGRKKLSESEQTQYDKHMEDAISCRGMIDKERDLQGLEAELNKAEGNKDASKFEGNKKSHEARDVRNTKEYRAAFNAYLMNEAGGEEKRILQQGVGADGGFLVPDEQYNATLIKFVDDMVFIRGLATSFKIIGSKSLGFPSLDTDVADAEFTTEILTGSESDIKFGKRELAPHPLAKRVKVSNTLLRNSVIPADTMVLQRLAYKFGIAQEKAFLTGNGVKAPLGVFTASTLGVSTGRDVSTDNTTTAITSDGLKEAKYALKPQYWPNAKWLFNRTAVKNIAKLKDLDGRYIWQDSQVASEPDVLMGFPVMMSEYVPNTFTTGLYVGMLADFSNYFIAENLEFEVKILNELYAETNQTGFIGRMEIDGMPVLEEAFVRVKLA